MIVSQREYMLLIAFLLAEASASDVNDAKLTATLYGLIGEDLAGDSWTYVPGQDLWMREEENEWREGYPNGPLLVAIPADSRQVLQDFFAFFDRLEEEAYAKLPPTPCPSCENPVKPGEPFCTQCGSIVGLVPEIAEADITVEASEAVSCPSCGASVSAKEKFCTQCGAPGKPTCPACGAIFEKRPRFCTACGANLQPDSEGP